ncbi:MAG: protein kinase, partial [Acidobacteriota bacterium]
WDLWALAVVAFEMLTGTHPFAFSAYSASQMAIGGNLDRCVEAPVLSPSAQAFFERAFALDSSRRPMSVRQFIEELEIALR